MIKMLRDVTIDRSKRKSERQTARILHSVEYPKETFEYVLGIVRARA